MTKKYKCLLVRLLTISLSTAALQSCFGQKTTVIEKQMTSQLSEFSVPQDANFGSTILNSYKIYKESDFGNVDYTKDVEINIQAPLLLTSPVSIKSKHYVRINGNGYSISEKYISQPVKESKVYQATDWDYDEKSQICTMTLPKELQTLRIDEADSVTISYELWFVRQTDAVISARNGQLTFLCKSGYKPTPNRRSWTPTPKFYFIYKNKEAERGLSYLINIGEKTNVDIQNLHLTGSNSYQINCRGKARLRNCHFLNGKSGAIKSTDELYIDSCEFRDFSNKGIICGYKSYTYIQNSTFTNIGLKGANEACVVSPSKIYIGNCTFHNFNYAAVKLGNMSTEKEEMMGASFFENNLLYWDAEWCEKIKDYGLSDSGAIYVGTNNRFAVIRNNTILNYGGHGYNRGIFCDDGAYNLTIYGNTISNTANYYDIDSRDCSKNPNRKVPVGYAFNTNNYIGYNICDGRIKAQGSSVAENNNCVFEHNTILGNKKAKYKNSVTNYKNISEPIVFDSLSIISDKGKILKLAK